MYMYIDKYTYIYTKNFSTVLSLIICRTAGLFLIHLNCSKNDYLVSLVANDRKNKN